MYRYYFCLVGIYVNIYFIEIGESTSKTRIDLTNKKQLLYL